MLHRKILTPLSNSASVTLGSNFNSSSIFLTSGEIFSATNLETEKNIYIYNFESNSVDTQCQYALLKLSAHSRIRTYTQTGKIIYYVNNTDRRRKKTKHIYVCIH
jgi:hypothetical protein